MTNRVHAAHTEGLNWIDKPVMPSDCRLIVFAKAPVPGKVKTRLLPSMGALGAASLYQRMVYHCLSTAANSRVGIVELWCASSTKHPFFRRCAEDFQLDLRLQSRGDIGKRMAHAFRHTLNRATTVLLIGTDCPSRTPGDLREAETALRQGIDAVLGPTEDGGYSLIGLRRCVPELFTGISWGTGSVLEQTRARLRDLHWAWQELPLRWDVDRPQDVQRLKSKGFLLDEDLKKKIGEIG